MLNLLAIITRRYGVAKLLEALPFQRGGSESAGTFGEIKVLEDESR